MRLNRVPMIYLAGGMRTNWQDKVIDALKNVTPVMFIDPRDHGLRTELEYTRWDIEGVRRADIVFGYLEADNPSGAGLALEIGFAAGKEDADAVSRKHILFVCDPRHPHHRYFGMARACADQSFETLEAGIDSLKALVQRLSA